MMVTRATRDDRSLFRMRLTARANRRFKFQKSDQFFIGVHNEALPVTMRIGNPDCSPLGING